jgi:hypothetical protein
VPRIVIKVIRSKRRRSAWSYIEPEIDREFDKEVKPRLTGYCERIVSPWTGDKPTFKARKSSTARYIAINIWPVGGKGADKWRWASEGTPMRTIVPRKPGGVLVFRADYKPRTTASGTYRGPGRATGDLVFTKRVKRHRIKPRNFEKIILRWYRQSKHFTHSMENAIRRGITAYRRAGGH